MLEESLSYPARGDWKRRSAIGGVLVLTTVALVPAIVLAGYAVRVLERPVGPDDEPPAFDDWVGLLRSGLAASVVWLGYVAIPALLVAGLLSAPDTLGINDGFPLVGLGLVLSPLVFLGTYLAPAATTLLARERAIPAAFDVREVAAIGRRPAYVEVTLYAIITWFTAGAVAIMLLVTVFGLLLVPSVFFIALVAITRLYGHAAVESTDLDGEPTAESVSPE